MRIATILALLALGFLAACTTTGARFGSSGLVTAQAPLPSGYLLGTQPRMQAMAHWDHLAASVADNCAKAIEHFHPDAGLRVFVAPAGNTPFAKTYREALITRLVDYGVPVSFTPDGAAVLETDLSWVTHRRALAKTPSGSRRAVEPGFTQGKDAQGGYQPVPVVLEESGHFDTGAVDSEIQVTSSLIHEGAYLYRDSSIFYVDRADWAEYRHQAPRGEIELKRFSLVNK